MVSNTEYEISKLRERCGELIERSHRREEESRSLDERIKELESDKTTLWCIIGFLILVATAFAGLWMGGRPS